MIFFYILIFALSCFILFWSGQLVVGALARVAAFLNWKEFVVAFFLVALAASIPNLTLGISAALKGIPELAFGDIVGGNLVDLTVAVALAALVAKGLPSDGCTIQSTSVFASVVAVLPILLILDGKLGRIDGAVLLLCFLFYILWLFSKEERFRKVCDQNNNNVVKKFSVFIKDIAGIVFGLALLVFSAEGIVRSSMHFADFFNMPLSLVGILIVGLGNALPETNFAIISARKGETGMILGNLMGSVVTAATLVLGTVALIRPIQITDFSPFAAGRIFLIAAALFFFFFVKSDKKVTKKEAVFLLILYLSFVLVELLIK